MSADLYLHAFADGELTEDDFRAFFACDMASKWFDAEARAPQSAARIGMTPSIWLGQEPAVATVAEVVGEEWPVIDAELIGRILTVLAECGSEYYRATSLPPVRNWLTRHRGKRAFCVAW